MAEFPYYRFYNKIYDFIVSNSPNYQDFRQLINMELKKERLFEPENRTGEKGKK
jgi:hypothetical protein